MESQFQIPNEERKIAFLLEKNLSMDEIQGVMVEARALRNDGEQVLIVKMNKNKKFQKEQLEKEGYQDIREFFCK